MLSNVSPEKERLMQRQKIVGMVSDSPFCCVCMFCSPFAENKQELGAEGTVCELAQQEERPKTNER